MKFFETPRLIVRQLSLRDSDDYFDMMGNPNVMNLIPRKAMSRKESNDHLSMLLDDYFNPSDRKVWALETKLGNEFLGLCAFLKNDENEDEIGYRLREQFWRKGFGTEITEGLLLYGFGAMKMEKITADVAVNNLNSVKILEKFMTLEKEFFNADDDCLDRRYEVKKKDWIRRLQ